ncbi:MAG: hypothetical protein A2589_00790 [Candidatus Vogelbacteria bacterium RIFOXYD1_FULL_46_19]|uniref:Uncharacterized protein n=1 Tax=Candidatus Vogelbacteria bacterium RIFOXYD1_FULL_46_19 TaxID=1802439 RepID=A0A1G2QHD0_9BACT|nr:MAG: hypothetical protein A2589_00790 [Candidatus Vogelbacteria bacterium RIFOXYD1_FULL_46_19]
METFISSPIFVLVTGLAEILIVIFGAIILAYVVVIVHNVNRMSKIARTEAENIAADIERARVDLKDGVEVVKKRVKLAVGAMSAKKIFDMLLAGAGRVTARQKSKRRSSRKSSDD